MNRRSLIRNLVGASIAVTTAARLSLDPATPEPPSPEPVPQLTNEQLSYIYERLAQGDPEHNTYRVVEHGGCEYRVVPCNQGRYEIQRRLLQDFGPLTG